MTSMGRPHALSPVAALVIMALALAACASAPKREPARDSAKPPSASTGGRFYLDDGPGGERSLAELERLPDAVPRAEPINPRTSRPYVVMGRYYEPMTRLEPFSERGTATWYGRRYHERQTATGERFDMYAMSAAHPRLPLPSYVRVTNLRNGRSAIVRVNDRGPFLHGRVIDLSYGAAARLGFALQGSTEVDVELITQFGATPASAAPVVADATQVASGSADAARQAGAPAQVGVRIDRTDESDRSVSPVAVPALATAGAAAARYLQLGAFGSRSNADSARRDWAAKLGALGESLLVREENGLFKVLAGPFAQAAQAAHAAERVRSLAGIEALQVSRQP